MSVDGLTNTIVILCQRLATQLRDGIITISDARTIESRIREAEGWLITARNELDPSEPAT